jgi:hypothetical protein
MNYNVLGKTGFKVSVIGFGGIPVQRVSADAAATIVNTALDRGINFFDTARGYTDSEAKLGAVLSRRRKEAVVATKSMARTREAMAEDIQRSLKELQVDYIDLYQLHNVKEKEALEQVLASDGALAALQEAQRDGVIKHIGITGHVKSILVEALKEADLATVQFPFNAVETDGARELFSQAEKTNAGVIVMKPLAGGALKNANLALRFIRQHPVSVIIPGMDSLEQVDENARAGEMTAALTVQEMKELEEDAGKLGSTFCRRCEYCQPCPQGINIPMIFLFDGYFTRYDMKDWALDRYRDLPVKAGECIQCGECEEKCPYSLPIRNMLAEVSGRLDLD